jgi:hypothetical protein
MTREEYYKSKIKHTKARVDKLKRKRNNKKKPTDQSEGASVSGGSLSGVASGLPSSGPGNWSAP